MGYTREFQSMLMEVLDEDGGGEECASGQIPEKKLRLSVDQVKVGKTSDLENKLEPERKVKFCSRAWPATQTSGRLVPEPPVRWKTKQLERDCGLFKPKF